MAIAEYAANTQLVSTTEHSIVTDTAGPDAATDDGVFQAVIDLSALADGDVFRFRVYEKAQAADTQRVVFECFFQNVQGTPNFASPALILMHGWDMTLLKISGTDRTITWSVRQIT